jgi:glycosyltransferase involved in cell wall biosynthesis
MPVRVKSSPAQPFGLPQPPPGWQQKPAGISLCMIVRDEERFLERCLASVGDAVDEIVVLDTGSKDRTMEIALGFGAIVHEREWRNDFAWARNEAVKLAKYRWIFQLDADEELLAESKAALQQIRTARAHLVGIWVRCINRADQYLGSDGTISHAVARIFPNHERIRYYGTIHEFPALDGATTTLSCINAPVKIVHHGYTAEMMSERSKFERNRSIIEAAVERSPDDAFNWYNLGMTAYLGGDYERGVQALRQMWFLSQAQGARPFVANGLTVLADALTDHLNKPEESLEFALAALKLAPHYANAHFSAGRALDGMKRYDEAREMYLAAIDDGKYLERQYVVDEDVSRWKAHNMIGGGYAAQRDDVSALHWFDEGLKSSPKVQALRINRGAALERLGRLDEAERTFAGLCEDLGDEQSVLQYVNFLLRHNPLQALSAIEQHYEKCSDDAAVAQLMAAAAVAQRLNHGDGEWYLLKACEIAPGSAEILGPLEAIYRSRGDDPAIQRLRAAEAQSQPKAPADFARRSQIAASQADFARALTLAEAGLRLAPMHAMLRYSAALACANLGRRADALAHLDAIVELPEDLQLHVLLMRAALLEGFGRLSEAEAALLSALPLAKKRVAVELGGFYMRAGRFADAQRIAEEALAS